MRVWLLLITFLIPTLCVAAQTSQIVIDAYVVNSAGNTQSTSNWVNDSSIGEPMVGQCYTDIQSAQAGFFNNYYFSKPTPTVTPTVTATHTPTVTGTVIYTFGGELIHKDYVYAAPNPIRGPIANIYFHLAESAEVEIKIYTTHNKLVMSKHWDHLAAGRNYWQWNVANQPNGVFLMLIKAKNNNKTTKLIKKLALIK